MPRQFSKRLPLAVLAVAVVALIAWRSLAPKEPQFAGLPASDYVRSVLSNNFFNGTVVTNRLMPMGAAAVPALTKVIVTEDGLWSHLYEKVYSSVPPWLRKQLRAPNRNRQLVINCAMALGYFGAEAKPAVPALAATYRRGDDFLKMMVSGQFSRIGPEARAAVPALLATAMQDSSQKVRGSTRGAAIHALARVDLAGRESASELTMLLKDSDTSVVIATVEALGSMAKWTPSLVPKLKEALGHSQLPVCVAAAKHLRDLSALTRESLNPFLNRLHSTNVNDRVIGATILVCASAFAPDVTFPLVKASADPDAKVREAAVGSLVVFAGTTNIDRIHRITAAKAVLQHGAADQSWSIMDLLPTLVPEVSDTLPLLVAALHNPNERTRGKAAQTLGRVGPRARDATPTLRLLLTDEWFNVREAATNALASIEAKTP